VPSPLIRTDVAGIDVLDDRRRQPGAWGDLGVKAMRL
jgi:hypothetical protein